MNTMKNNGKNLEQLIRLVEEVYQSNPETKIYSNYKIENTAGNKREIDLFITSFINNFEISIAVECKEYKNKVSVDKIEAFKTKCDRIPAINKKIFVSENGFQKDAIDCAKTFGIELYTFSYLKDNVRKILLPIQQIKPVFKGFEVLLVTCEENPYLEDISISSIQEYFSIYDKEIFSLYRLVETAAKQNWSDISGMAFYHWMKNKTAHHKIHFFIKPQGIYFQHKQEKIFVIEIECNAIIDFEFIDVPSKEMEYKNFSDNTTKANILNLDLGENLSSKIVVDNKNHLHFFDTSNEKQVKKLDILYSYDPKTDTFTNYNQNNKD